MKKLELKSNDSNIDHHQLGDVEHLIVLIKDLMNVSFISGCQQIKILNLSGSKQLCDITVLQSLVQLKHLMLCNCDFWSFANLPSFPNLTILDLSFNNLQDFSECKSYDKLQSLFMQSNNMVSFFGLPDLPSLQNLDLRGNPVENISLPVSTALSSLQQYNGQIVFDAIRSFTDYLQVCEQILNLSFSSAQFPLDLRNKIEVSSKYNLYLLELGHAPRLLRSNCLPQYTLESRILYVGQKISFQPQIVALSPKLKYQCGWRIVGNPRVGETLQLIGGDIQIVNIIWYSVTNLRMIEIARDTSAYKVSASDIGGCLKVVVSQKSLNIDSTFSQSVSIQSQILNNSANLPLPIAELFTSEILSFDRSLFRVIISEQCDYQERILKAIYYLGKLIPDRLEFEWFAQQRRFQNVNEAQLVADESLDNQIVQVSVFALFQQQRVWVGVAEARIGCLRESVDGLSDFQKMTPIPRTLQQVSCFKLLAHCSQLQCFVSNNLNCILSVFPNYSEFVKQLHYYSVPKLVNEQLIVVFQNCSLSMVCDPLTMVNQSVQLLNEYADQLLVFNQDQSRCEILGPILSSAPQVNELQLKLVQEDLLASFVYYGGKQARLSHKFSWCINGVVAVKTNVATIPLHLVICSFVELLLKKQSKQQVGYQNFGFMISDLMLNQLNVQCEVTAVRFDSKQSQQVMSNGIDATQIIVKMPEVLQRLADEYDEQFGSMKQSYALKMQEKRNQYLDSKAIVENLLQQIEKAQHNNVVLRRSFAENRFFTCQDSCQVIDLALMLKDSMQQQDSVLNQMNPNLAALQLTGGQVQVINVSLLTAPTFTWKYGKQSQIIGLRNQLIVNNCVEIEFEDVIKFSLQTCFGFAITRQQNSLDMDQNQKMVQIVKQIFKKVLNMEPETLQICSFSHRYQLQPQDLFCPIFIFYIENFTELHLDMLEGQVQIVQLNNVAQSVCLQQLESIFINDMYNQADNQQLKVQIVSNLTTKEPVCAVQWLESATRQHPNSPKWTQASQTGFSFTYFPHQSNVCCSIVFPSPISEALHRLFIVWPPKNENFAKLNEYYPFIEKKLEKMDLKQGEQDYQMALEKVVSYMNEQDDADKTGEPSLEDSVVGKQKIYSFICYYPIKYIQLIRSGQGQNFYVYALNDKVNNLQQVTDTQYEFTLNFEPEDVGCDIFAKIVYEQKNQKLGCQFHKVNDKLVTVSKIIFQEVNHKLSLIDKGQSFFFACIYSKQHADLYFSANNLQLCCQEEVILSQPISSLFSSTQGNQQLAINFERQQFQVLFQNEADRLLVHLFICFSRHTLPIQQKEDLKSPPLLFRSGYLFSLANLELGLNEKLEPYCEQYYKAYQSGWKLTPVKIFKNNTYLQQLKKDHAFNQLDGGCLVGLQLQSLVVPVLEFSSKLDLCKKHKFSVLVEGQQCSFLLVREANLYWQIVFQDKVTVSQRVSNTIAFVQDQGVLQLLCGSNQLEVRPESDEALEQLYSIFCTQSSFYF